MAGDRRPRARRPVTFLSDLVYGPCQTESRTPQACGRRQPPGPSASPPTSTERGGSHFAAKCPAAWRGQSCAPRPGARSRKVQRAHAWTPAPGICPLRRPEAHRAVATAAVIQAGAGLTLFLATAYFLYLVADRVKRPGESTLPAHLLRWTWPIPLVWVVLATIIGKQSAEFLQGRTADVRQREALAGLVFIVPSHAVLTLAGVVTFSAAQAGESGVAGFGWALMLGAGFALVFSMAASFELSVENAFRNTKGP